ncbi:MAG: hypothetical protein HQM10_21755 [Candidatus Riflebacteria bacterium]|nr:hypothetical protein [Candidatus Riflebacteria bacterium]
MLDSKMKGPKKIPVPDPLPADSASAGKICSICSSGICQGETIVFCRDCKLPYHNDCWKEIGGCGTYGCLSAPAVQKTETAPADIYQPGWTTEKTCPACQKKILSNALICKWCKATFPHEKPMTFQEYCDREYIDEESLKIRNFVIGNFIFSTMGCFFPFSIAINLFHLFYPEGFLFRYKRLPPTLKVIFHAGLGVSIVWGILAILFLIFR